MKSGFRVIACAAILFFPVVAAAQDCTDPNGQEGAMLYNKNYQAFQGCVDGTWVAFHEPGCPDGSGCHPCTGGAPPSIGETCNDGTIYAGDSPDGDVPMYTTPADAPGTYTWNDGTTNYTDMSMANCTDGTPGTASSCQTGEANTAFLVGATGEPDYPFAAAEYCDGLSANGHDDWYLPAQDELDVLHTNKNAGDLDGTFNETGSFPAGWYWSSSERDNGQARFQKFGDGFQGNYVKYPVVAVRCVRR